MPEVTGMYDGIGKKLADALGLPPRTRLIEIRFAYNEVITVKCEYLPDGDRLEDAVNLIKTFELHAAK